jgi:ACS family sodium-dependent inorganic phosphate cotransporter-like MFS transporter 5
MWLFALICGVVADKMVKTSAFGLDTGMIRKLFNNIGHIGPALGLLGLAYTGCSQTYSIFWLCMSVMFNGAIYSGFAVSKKYNMQEEIKNI